MRLFSSRILGFQFYIGVVFVVIGCTTSIFSTSLIIVEAFSGGKKYCRGGARYSGRHSAVTGTFQEMVVEPCKSTSSVDGVGDGDGDGESSHKKVTKILSEWFQGDFDNYAQVVEDRRNGLLPREGGGHEHFHCTLVPVTESTRLAAFFFDGNPNRIFRFRYYELLTPTIINDVDHQHNNNVTVEMRLNTLNPELEQLLKSHSTDPLSWPDIFNNFQHEGVSSNSSSSSSSSGSDEKNQKIIPLSKCEIVWSFDKDPIQHAYISDSKKRISDDGKDDEAEDMSLHAVMVHGEQVVNSTIVPGMQIRILDQLSLYQHVFYINDRGFDPITGAFIYGNQRDIPYRLERVSNILPSAISAADDDDDGSSTTADRRERLQLKVINPELEWTIGPKYRTIEEYDSKLKVIGGPSTGINKKDFKSGQGKS